MKITYCQRPFTSDMPCYADSANPNMIFCVGYYCWTHKNIKEFVNPNKEKSNFCNKCKAKWKNIDPNIY
jgi:hypothetical protein